MRELTYNRELQNLKRRILSLDRTENLSIFSTYNLWLFHPLDHLWSQSISRCIYPEEEILKFTISLRHVSLTNLEELSLWSVLAFPRPSRTGFDWSSWYLTSWQSLLWPVTAAMYCITSLPASVLPEPLSPVRTMTWSWPLTRSWCQARSARE